METPDIVTPRELFGTPSRYVAPVFQRYYTWKEKQLEDFFDDLDDIDPNTSGQQFLGAIVLQQKKVSGPGAPRVYLMIDGQQRLTTLYLVLLGLASMASGEDSSSLVETYLAVNISKYAGQPKLVPTAQDRGRFYQILKTATEYDSWNVSDEPPLPGARPELDAQWERIQARLAERVLTPTKKIRRKDWERITNAVLDRFEMVSIVLEADEDPNLIFGRLNARGTPLTVADLVRNSVFTRFEHDRPQKSERFYNDRWLPFERSFPNSAALQRYFQPFAVIRTGGKSTKATAFADLEELWLNRSAEQVLRELEEYAPYYLSLNSYQPVAELSDAMNTVLRDLAEMPKLSVSWPFTIQVLRAVAGKKLAAGAAEKSLRFVESMLVRRALVGWEPTGLHAIFKSLWKETGAEPAEVAKRLRTGTIKSPTNDEIIADLSEVAVDSRKILPYVLKQYERTLRAHEGTGDDLPVSTPWIEHVLPQSHDKHWSATFTSKQHAAQVGLLGNLTLLTGKQNQKSQNEPWVQKRARYATSDWLMTRNLADIKNWDPRFIAKRTKDLAAWIIKRWPQLPA